MTATAALKYRDERVKTPLNIAILLNSFRSPFIAEIRESYVRSIGAVSQDCRLTFFYPADKPGGDFPDPDAFDLIVVGGSNADPRKKHEWIMRVHKFIMSVVADYPGKKMCGICWGHQTISLVFGGEIVDMDTPELGVTEAKLTQAGHHFFSGTASGKGTTPNSTSPRNGVVRLQQHHRRAVGVRPEGFNELLAGHQSFLSHNNAILTFQGHPEKDARTAKLRIADAVRWFGIDMGDRRAVNELVSQMEMEHDGAEIWARVLQWARE
ncbi:class I glutamine amidotransferase-like protein [Podospora didyma]|uniref:Class I glutamine amidotransferase-like protein n=1 Tax=Podospora didyma TaxID=330526 RepID=A0AAE0K275_9PEZI|nr:class I glutamine amidotransferase-like protein [Podospora didyma]